GHAAGAMAVNAARDAARSGAAEFALAGGVDSGLDARTLGRPGADQQARSAGPPKNLRGLGRAGWDRERLLALPTAADRRPRPARVAVWRGWTCGPRRPPGRRRSSGPTGCDSGKG